MCFLLFTTILQHHNTAGHPLIKSIMKKEYIPISCDFHSELELLALRGTLCQILYKSEGEKIINISGIIKDLYTLNKEEFLLLQDSIEIRLDQLISVNGMELINYC